MSEFEQGLTAMRGRQVGNVSMRESSQNQDNGDFVKRLRESAGVLFNGQIKPIKHTVDDLIKSLARVQWGRFGYSYKFKPVYKDYGRHLNDLRWPLTTFAVWEVCGPQYRIQNGDIHRDTYRVQIGRNSYDTSLQFQTPRRSSVSLSIQELQEMLKDEFRDGPIHQAIKVRRQEYYFGGGGTDSMGDHGR